MTYEEFIKLAEMLREAQEKHFRFRRPSDLYAARDLERRVDAAIKEHKEAAVEAASPKLF